MNKSLNVSRKANKNKFTESEKRFLIAIVKNKNHLWDKSHKMHRNRKFMKATWREIADELGKTDEDCKQAWRSILDSKRYFHQKRKSRKKSVSSCDLEFLSEESQDPWEFSADLNFLIDSSELRATYSTEVLSDPEGFSMDDFSCKVEAPFSDLPMLTPQSNKPTYSHAGTNKSTSATAKTAYEVRAGVSKVTDAVTTLVDLAKSQSASSNKHFLNYVDSLLLKLPNEVSEEIQGKIIFMLHQEISFQRSNKTK